MLDGFNTQQEQRRRYPMPADKVFRAVLEKVGGQVQQATTLLSTFGHIFEKISAELTGKP
jgi:hypothetical protein